jgi:hypothetical protein
LHGNAERDGVGIAHAERDSDALSDAARDAECYGFADCEPY